MTDTPPITPRVDTPPPYTCGTWYRAGCVTAGCPGCQSTDRRAGTAAAR